MRHCLENGINPKSTEAPNSVDEAIKSFFKNSGHWDIAAERSKQAESIQILASGPKKNSSLVIYDDGEGQHPEDFPDTFLSLLSGNKNKIQFVQGKYNMGGSGALVFCGQKRYQLIASKKFDGTGQFGFTILRKHPLSPEEEKKVKCTWYEYLLFNEKIPSFEINTLDLGLRNREFKTGSIIKLYSYDLPSGSRSVISRDLNQSINEYLFEPALPLYTIDRKERYPNDYNLQRPLFGLKRRLDEVDNKYIKETFSETSQDQHGQIKINVYVFNPSIEGKSVSETKATIRSEFFKNHMAVMFSVNGQVHGHYTTEFITNTLKFNLLKGYLLIHVDCTNLNISFRNELFMASRDRMKNGTNSSLLRRKIAGILTKGRLKEINKEWKDTLTLSSENAEDLLKDFSKNLPLNHEFRKLISNTIASDVKNKGKSKAHNPKKKNNRTSSEIPFNPKRYPSQFKIDLKTKNEDEIPISSIPLGGERNIYFSTDVEDQYFDRIEEPGELQITVLSSHLPNEETGVNFQGLPNDPGSLIDVSISSPSTGKIRVNIKSKDVVDIGDEIQCMASLTNSVGEDLKQLFIVRISNKEKKPKKITEPNQEEDNLGLPAVSKVFKDKWDVLGNSGIEMGHHKVMYPHVEHDKLDTIYVNMDSSIFKKFCSKLKSPDQLKLADNRYISSVYFHTLFLYSISKKRKFQFSSSDDTNIDLIDYLMDVFDDSYTEFLLRFEIDTLIENLSD